MLKIPILAKKEDKAPVQATKSVRSPLDETVIVRRVLEPGLAKRIAEANKLANQAIGSWLSSTPAFRAPRQKMPEEVKNHLAAVVELLKEVAKENPGASFVFDTELISNGAVKILVNGKIIAGMSIDTVFTRVIRTFIISNRTAKSGTLRPHKFWNTGPESLIALAPAILNHNPSTVSVHHDDEPFKDYESRAD